MRLNSFIALPVLLLASGCVVAPEPFPEIRQGPTPVAGSSKTFTVFKEIAGYGAWPPASGVQLPIGTYSLEAEDADYWYFHAPTSLEFRVVERGRVTERHRVSGGIRLSKHSNATPPAAYKDSAGSLKETVLELGPTEFAWMEGRYWQKNF